MALHHCQNCTTSYALGLEACPHCRQPTTATVSVHAETAETQAAPVVEAEAPRRRSRREPQADSETASADD